MEEYLADPDDEALNEALNSAQLAFDQKQELVRKINEKTDAQLEETGPRLTLEELTGFRQEFSSARTRADAAALIRNQVLHQLSKNMKAVEKSNQDLGKVSDSSVLLRRF